MTKMLPGEAAQAALREEKWQAIGRSGGMLSDAEVTACPHLSATVCSVCSARTAGVIRDSRSFQWAMALLLFLLPGQACVNCWLQRVGARSSS